MSEGHRADRNSRLSLKTLVTPSQLPDEPRFGANGPAMRARLERRGVALRPHLKTAKYSGTGERLPVLAEVDADGHRSGMRSEDQALLLAIERVDGVTL